MVRAGCVFVAGIHTSRTWTSGSFESVLWNACVHRLDLGLYSHPKDFWGEWSLNPCQLQRKNPLFRKISREEGRTRDAVDSEPKHYQRAIPAPVHIILFYFQCMETTVASARGPATLLTLAFGWSWAGVQRAGHSTLAVYFPTQQGMVEELGKIYGDAYRLLQHGMVEEIGKVCWGAYRLLQHVMAEGLLGC